ncbi:hypothetical protein JYG35_17945 [Pseudomonas rhodesiae]|uniref:hypothetical protein n=1 Tax=Pseudomonas rhodesiae TaxID=76760 RepID=UPI001BCBD30B|nr:hypothetical protein [Pseudomonas rhodesiae]QVN05523.1 hypothetical protein JYG35_17945 [Pseudomonas rhodesiae]
MSLTINNPNFVKPDTSILDQPSSKPTSADAKSTPPSSTSRSDVSTARFENSSVKNNELMFSAGALSKMFDMIEQFFRSMREVFVGRNNAPDLMSGLKHSPGLTPDVTKAPVKPDAADQPATPGADKRLVKPDMEKQSVKPDAADPSVTPGLEKRRVTPQTTDLSGKADAEKSMVLADARNTPTPVMPQVPRPEVAVTNDAKANVQVNVNVSHCHCPDHGVLPDSGIRPRVVPDVRVGPNPDVMPGVTPKPAPRVKPEVKPDTKPDVKLEVKPDTNPAVKLDVKPDTNPAVKLDVKPDTNPAVKLDVKPDTKPNVTPPVKPDTLVEVKPDKTEPDLTSPGPAENTFDNRDWRFNRRPAFRR